MVTVTLYGRPGCCLCEDALEVVQRVRSRRAFELVQRDIERDEALLSRYLERIPVIAINGHDVFELTVSEGELEHALSAIAPSVE